jgi:hypothetical protein
MLKGRFFSNLDDITENKLATMDPKEIEDAQKGKISAYRFKHGVSTYNDDSQLLVERWCFWHWNLCQIHPFDGTRCQTGNKHLLWCYSIGGICSLPDNH